MTFFKTRGGLASGSMAIVALGVAAACSSSSSSGPATPPTGGDSGSTDASALPVPLPDGAMPPFVGPGMLCPTLTQVTTATRLTLDVTWPPTNSTAKPTAGSNPQLFIWLLSNYTVGSDNTISGATYTCGNQTPPFSLTGLGDTAQGEPSGVTAQLQITFLPQVWDSIMTHMNSGMGTPATGSIGGWNIGSSFEINPVTSVLGLKPTSMYASPSTMWPMYETSIPSTDYSDDDDDGHIGITATPLGTSSTSMPYVLPVTSLTGGGPPATKLFVVTRTELALYGKSTSCTTGEGTATVTLLNNHVIGCELQGYDADSGPDADTASLCDDGAISGAQTQFLDTNTTQYQVVSGTYQTIRDFARSRHDADVRRGSQHAARADGDVSSQARRSDGSPSLTVACIGPKDAPARPRGGGRA